MVGFELFKTAFGWNPIEGVDGEDPELLRQLQCREDELTAEWAARWTRELAEDVAGNEGKPAGDDA
jgi:predicted thioredoxin/glutaredoxin